MRERLARLFQNVFVKIISIYIAAMLIIFSIVIVANVEAAKAMDEKDQNASYHTLLTYAQSIEAEFQKILQIQNMTFTDDDILDFLYLYGEYSEFERLMTNKRIGSTFSKYLMLCPMINDISVYSLQQRRMISYSGKIQELDERNPIAYESPYVMRERGFSVEWAYRDAFASITIDTRYLLQQFRKIQSVFPTAEAALLWEKEPIARTAGFQLDARLFETAQRSAETKRLVDAGEETVFSYGFGGDTFSVSVQYQPDYSADSARNINFLLFLSIGVVAALLAIVFFYLSKLVKKPMNSLTDLMQEVEKGNLDLEVKYDSQNQFGFIFAGFQRMISSLREYIEINYQQRIEINQSELKQLQSQINPHFLYNCFFNISKLCKVEDSETAMILSQKLAAYYMYITRNKEDVVPLSAEYQHTKTYLDIQQIRFQNRVQVKMEEVSAACGDVVVPKIILQPLIENAYKYVFDHMDADGRLEISAELAGETILISVADNGNISDEMIALMNRKVCEVGRNGESTGVVNVHRRLELRTPGDGLRFSRSALGGLLVEMRIHIK